MAQKDGGSYRKFCGTEQGGIRTNIYSVSDALNRPPEQGAASSQEQ